MSYQAIQLEIDQASNVATITLNRPDKLNSFTRAMHRELQSALDDVEAAGARALILTGAGRGFCAGQDLADLDFTPGASTDLGTLIDEHFKGSGYWLDSALTAEISDQLLGIFDRAFRRKRRRHHHAEQVLWT